MCMYVFVQTHVHEASFDAHYSPNASRLKFHGDEERFRFPDHMHIVGYGGTPVTWPLEVLFKDDSVP